MKTFQQFVSEAAKLTFSKKLGNPNQSGSGDFGIGASYGGLGASVDRTTTGGQGDRITQGVTQAINNLGTSVSTSSDSTTSTEPSLNLGGVKVKKKDVDTGIRILSDIQGRKK